MLMPEQSVIAWPAANGHPSHDVRSPTPPGCIGGAGPPVNGDIGVHLLTPGVRAPIGRGTSRQHSSRLYLRVPLEMGTAASHAVGGRGARLWRHRYPNRRCPAALLPREPVQVCVEVGRGADV